MSLACSTPFGVTVFFTPKKPALKILAGSAQRLSASLSSSRGPRRTSATARTGAQRLSASLSSSRVEAGHYVAHERLCSTPFGVTVFFTHRPHADIAHTGRCSTPFGVTVFFTARVADWRPATLCGCSTPFGVTVFFTRTGRAAAPPRRVLNAFRRHCLLHMTPMLSAPAPQGAQRLSASLSSSRPSPARTSARVGCAQRLSASLSSSRRASRPCSRRGSRVLNAFRRHCLLHAERIDHQFARRGVLNAFRRHCLLHAGCSGSPAVP